jgi:hypothetical protein
MLQESMGDGSKIVIELGKMFVGWESSFIDARGLRSSGVIIGWETRSLLCTNILSIDLGLGTIFYSNEMDTNSWFATCIDQ